MKSKNHNTPATRARGATAARPPASRSTPRARKSLGQYFLRDSGVLADIAEAVGPPSVPVVEIGPGTGQLTAALLQAGHEVIAIEVEERMLRHLRVRFHDERKLTLVHGDARDVVPASVIPPGQEFIVAGNLPYFAASYIVRKVLESDRQPRALVVMVQREVAREYAAVEKLSLLAVAIQVYATATLLFDVPPEAFEPSPAVWSSVVRLDVRPEPLVPRELLDTFFAHVSKIFRQPRKQIHNALALEREAALRVLEQASIEPARRPETLTIPEWLTLVETLRRDAVER